MTPVVTLTTDFGTRDPWVAAMKGVILGITRAAGRRIDLVDLTHTLAPHDVREGALALEAAAPWFPPGTVHLAVVDPEVGSARRGLAVASGGHLWVGPDNGLFTPALEAAGWRAWALEAPEFRLPTVSRTFHGRDVFAPAAARLALGLDPARLGPPLADPVRLPWPRARATRQGVVGEVVHVDRFGNLVTSIDAALVAGLGEGARVRIGRRRVPLVGTYADLAPGRAGAMLGSSGRLEIAVNRGSAAARLRARRGTVVVLSRSSSSRARASERGRRRR